MTRRQICISLAFALLVGCAGDEGGSGGTGATGAGGAGGGGAITTEQALELLRQSLHVLVGAEATVIAGGQTNHFQLQWVENNPEDPDNPGFVFGGCAIFGTLDESLQRIESYTVTANLAETWPRENGDFFSVWTPSGFPAGSQTGAEVQMGVFHALSGETWSVVPPGRSALSCEAVPGQEAIACTVRWIGVMAETGSEKSAGGVVLTCTFARPDSDYRDCRPAEGGCDDGNDCTHDYCTSDGSCAHVPIDEITLTTPDFYLFDFEYIEQIAEGCDLDGSHGQCDSDVCVPRPCGDNCFGFDYRPEDDTCIVTYCRQAPAECGREVLTECTSSLLDLQQP